jgi:hypothetical protein
LAPLAVVLTLVGVLLADGDGVLETFGFLLLAQGLGLIAAILPMSFGHNPLSKD